ncbi:hypothetical protein HYFRA_00007489 [Hymenoscyphus fraxineus]|uniref:Uncharacterized protein n=1 Tax=Hymenoscyphus fraxineus TaxID=746836 RepID=A0A9N9KRA0_9HELO|nr:hypothetical protein HYFRA_00007489 [Hymenoscyphus fraxineus]
MAIDAQIEGPYSSVSVVGFRHRDKTVTFWEVAAIGILDPALIRRLTVIRPVLGILEMMTTGYQRSGFADNCFVEQELEKPSVSHEWLPNAVVCKCKLPDPQDVTVLQSDVYSVLSTTTLIVLFVSGALLSTQ